jgi:MinD superfamily P-loop ATPase
MAAVGSVVMLTGRKVEEVCEVVKNFAGVAGRMEVVSRNPLVIVDGPPGIGCPVIASIGGATAVLVVTEPTISGLHDMERVIKVADHFSVPTMICINKFDINRGMSEKIEEFANKSGMEIVGKIPYDPIVTKAQIEGKSIVEFRDTPASNEMKSMWERIKDKLA